MRLELASWDPASRLIQVLSIVALSAAGPAAAQLGPALAGRMAQAGNAAVVNNNPAGITYVDGTQIVLDASLAFSFSEFKVGEGTTTSGGDPDDDECDDDELELKVRGVASGLENRIIAYEIDTDFDD